jgi:predicted Zn-dependent peptidase
MRACLATLGLFGLIAAAPATPDALRFPTATVIDLGATRLLSEIDADAAISGVQIFVAAGLDRESASNDGVAALVAECVLRTPIDGVAVRDALEARGGSVNYTVDGRSVHYYVEARSDRLAPLVSMFASALGAPDFSASTLAAAKASLSMRQTEFESNPLSVGIQMFRRSYYATGAGQAALGSSASVANLSSRDAAAFYRANYKRRATFSSVVGTTSPDLGVALEALANALPDGTVAAVPERAHAIPALPPRIVTHRDVPMPWIVVGFAAPSPNSRDFGAMLVLQSLLTSTFQTDTTTTTTLADRSIGAFYLYDSTPASMVVYVNGALVDPSGGLRDLLLVAHSLSIRSLNQASLAHFKAAARGQFLTDSLNVSDRAYLLGAFSSQGLGDDAINAALSALDATTAGDVQRVARSYLQRYIMAIVLPRQNPRD